MSGGEQSRESGQYIQVHVLDGFENHAHLCDVYRSVLSTSGSNNIDYDIGITLLALTEVFQTNIFCRTRRRYEGEMAAMPTIIFFRPPSSPEAINWSELVVSSA